MNAQRVKLRSVLSAMVAREFVSGKRVTTNELWDIAQEEYPDLIEAESQRLIKDATIRLLRQIMKEAMRADKSDIRPNMFANEERPVRVPRCIAVPSGGGGREMLWLPTFSASIDEVRAHIAYLLKCVQADQAKANKLGRFVELVVDLVGDDDTSTPISELLQGLEGRAA